MHKGHCENIGTHSTYSPAPRVAPVSSPRLGTNWVLSSSDYGQAPSLLPDGCSSSSPSSPRVSSSLTCELITLPSLSRDLALLHGPPSQYMSDLPDCTLPFYIPLPSVNVFSWVSVDGASFITAATDA